MIWKRICAWMLALCLVYSAFAGLPMSRAQAAGNTIEIGTADAFIALCNENFNNIKDKTIKLTANIDMSGKKAVAPIGGNEAFNGTFDGQGYMISNLQIAGAGLCTGLFGHVGTSGSITRLGLENVSVSGKNNTGSFAGVLTGSITKCYVTGTISGAKYTGGITGLLHAGTIENCWTDAKVSGTGYTAGLFGGCDFDTRPSDSQTEPLSPLSERIPGDMVIRNNLVLGSVTGTSCAGILGDMGVSGTSTYKNGGQTTFEGNVAWADSVESTKGGYYGPVYAWWSKGRTNDDHDAELIYNNLYWADMKLTGKSDPVNQTNGECKVHSELKIVSASKEDLGKQKTYENLNWNFENVWIWSKELGHPVLKGIEINIPGQFKTPMSLVSTWVGSPKTTRAFTWYTDTIIEDTIVQAVPQADYVDASSFGGSSAIIATGSAYELQTAADGTARNIHKANLTGLQPGTTYCYRAGDGKNWSKVYTFTTEEANETAFTFFSMTDTQNAYDKYANTLDYAAKAYPDAKFIVHSGDVVQSNSSAGYDDILSRTQDYNASLPNMVAPGNHELQKDNIEGKDFVAGIDNYKSHYQFPDNGPEGQKQLVYSFDYGNAHFVSLNTNKSFDVAYLKWVKDDLQASDKTWKIVNLHHSPFNAYGISKKQLIHILQEAGADLVIFGHNHVLARSNPLELKADNSTVDNKGSILENGVYYAEKGFPVYYSSGCAGSSAGSMTSAPDKYAEGLLYFQLAANASKDSVYGAITITEDSLTIRTHSVPNRYPDRESQLLETFVLRKPLPEFVPPKAIEGLVYNGAAQTLVEPGSTSHGKMVYSFDGETWFEELPMAADAMTHTVWYKVMGDANYRSSEPQRLYVTIAPPHILPPTGDGANIALWAALVLAGILGLLCSRKRAANR